MTFAVMLTDEEVVIRPLQLEGAIPLYEAVRDSLTDLKPWRSGAHDDFSLNEVRGFIKIGRARWRRGLLDAFAITDARTKDSLGGVSLSHINPVYHYCLRRAHVFARPQDFGLKASL